MPIYEYACESCGHVFDVLQKMAAAPLLECPECSKPTLKKLLSAPNFRLKGGGWYETDFKKDNQRNLAGGDKEPSKSDSKSSDDKSSGDKAKKDKSSDKPKSKSTSNTKSSTG